MKHLLDVNALVSLLDANHEHHAAITAWRSQSSEPWASCPITQNGYLRIVTQESYPNTISIGEAIKTLSQAVSAPSHEFLPDNVSLLDQQLIAHKHFQGHRQLTDIYLLALSVFHKSRLVTFDNSIPYVAVRQATKASVHVIRP